jgi:hypothetical protein
MCFQVRCQCVTSMILAMWEPEIGKKDHGFSSVFNIQETSISTTRAECGDTGLSF